MGAQHRAQPPQHRGVLVRDGPPHGAAAVQACRVFHELRHHVLEQALQRFPLHGHGRNFRPRHRAPRSGWWCGVVSASGSARDSVSVVAVIVVVMVIVIVGVSIAAGAVFAAFVVVPRQRSNGDTLHVGAARHNSRKAVGNFLQGLNAVFR